MSECTELRGKLNFAHGTVKNLKEQLAAEQKENKRLREAISDKEERLVAIKELADMYKSLLGTDREEPWVRTMAAISAQTD